MKVLCSHKGEALYCKSMCKHANSHTPHVFPNETDCRETSKCSNINKDCRCVEKEIELIPD
jgi:hypothetical protein